MNDGGGDGAGCFDIKEWAEWKQRIITMKDNFKEEVKTLYIISCTFRILHNFTKIPEVILLMLVYSVCISVFYWSLHVAGSVCFSSLARYVDTHFLTWQYYSFNATLKR